MSIAYFLSHNGLGDNISNIGAIRYLLNGYYDEIYFLCKDTNLVNLKLIYNSMRVHLIPVDSRDEMKEYTRILAPIYLMENVDILVTGFCLSPHYKSKINNQKLLTHKKIQCYRIQPRFDFIRSIYEEMHLDLSVYYTYFQIDSTPNSLTLYDDIKQYNIIFVHTQSSNISIDLSDNFKHLIDNEATLIVCADHNVYPPNNGHYILADKYINKPVSDYIDIIYNASQIYVVDSSFSTIIIPLMNMGKLKAIECNIFDRKDKRQIDWSFKIDRHTHHAIMDMMNQAMHLSMS